MEKKFGNKKISTVIMIHISKKNNNKKIKITKIKK